MSAHLSLPLSGTIGALAAFDRAAARLQVLHAEQGEVPRLPFRAFVEQVLHMQPSPAMAAIMDASEGLPVTTIDDETSRRMFGCPRSGLPTKKPMIVVVCAGGRAGKTTKLAAPKMLHAAWTARMATLAPGESAQAAVIAPKKELSQQAVDAARGLISQTPELRSAIDGSADEDSKIGSAHIIRLRRKDGKQVQVRLRAPGVGGTGGRGFVLPVAVLEEAAFFYADSSKAVNDEEVFAATLQRVAMPDGQMWIISTPLYEGVGVMERFLAEEWGKHEDALVVRAPTRLLNPTWDPEGKLERALRKKDPDRARREIDAIGMTVGGGETFYTEDEIKGSFVMPYEPSEIDSIDVQRWELSQPMLRFAHTAACDMGFRKNSSALFISRSEEEMVRGVFRLELRPQREKPLRPSVVVREFAFQCMRHHAEVMFGDIHYADTAHEELEKLRRALEDPSKADEEQREWVERAKADPFARTAKVPVYVEWSMDIQHVANAHSEMRRRMQEKLVELPNDEHLIGQARGTKRKILPSGQVVIVLPKQGLAHGDVWGAAVISCTEAALGETFPLGGTIGAGDPEWS